MSSKSDAMSALHTDDGGCCCTPCDLCRLRLIVMFSSLALAVFSVKVQREPKLRKAREVRQAPGVQLHLYVTSPVFFSGIGGSRIRKCGVTSKPLNRDRAREEGGGRRERREERGRGRAREREIQRASEPEGGETFAWCWHSLDRCIP